MTDDRKKQMEELLWDLHEAVLRAITRRISDENCKSYDLANAIKFLKDNRKTIDEAEVECQRLWQRTNPLDFPFPGPSGEE